jgi:hypothetical protein
MKHFKKVKKELTKNGIDWELGTKTGWSKNSLVFDGGDCKILLYVKEDDNGDLILDYYDYFVGDEYSPIFDCMVQESSTSHRGSKSSVKDMLNDLNLI